MFIMEVSAEKIKEYMALANSRLEKAYAPYSNFEVSAVLVMKDGTIFTGINIENVSFGATICAERVAIVSAVNAGYRKADFQAIFVASHTKKAISPCSLCRQVFVEFFPENMPVYLGNNMQEITTFTVGALVPYAFESMDM